MARKNKGRLTESLLLALMLTAAVPLPAGAQPDGATGQPQTDPGRLEHAAQEISRQIQERHVRDGPGLGVHKPQKRSDCQLLTGG